MRVFSAWGTPGPASSTTMRTRSPDAFDADPHGPAGVLRGVLEEVGHGPFEAALVDRHRPVPPLPGHLDGQVRVAVAGGDPRQEVAEQRRLEVHLDAAGVDAGDLEEVEHHLVEALHLADDDVERLLRPLGQVGAAAVEHLDRGRQRGDRRAQLVAHVRGEAGLALDPALHGVGHVVERRHHLVEVRVGLGFETGVEVALGQLARRAGHTRQRPQEPAARVGAERRGADGGDRRADEQRREDHAQRASQAGHREHLDVGGVHLGGVDADGHVGRAAELEALGARAALHHGITQRRRQRLLVELGVRREPRAAVVAGRRSRRARSAPSG